jgi:uncharacterized protein YegP (UPF0339 family)
METEAEMNNPKVKDMVLEYLKAKNGQVIATSEMYPTAAICKKGIMAVKRIAAKAKIVEN